MNLDHTAISKSNGAVISELTTHLRIEGGSVQDDFNFSRRTNRRGWNAIDQQACHLCVRGALCVANKS